jgi:hypothetical protein
VGGEPESKHQETKDHQAVPAGRPQGTPRKGRQEGAQAHAAFPSCSRREHQVRAREGQSLFLSGNILVKYHREKMTCVTKLNIQLPPAAMENVY